MRLDFGVRLILASLVTVGLYIYSPVPWAAETYLRGRVYDDATGLPLAKAEVWVAEKPATQSDGEGRYTLQSKEGPQALRFTAPGYIEAYRSLKTAPKVLNWATDVRLTPQPTQIPFDRTTGNSLQSADETIQLTVAPGALQEGAKIGFTEIGGQGLPAPLPPGWRLLEACRVDVGKARPHTPLRIQFHTPFDKQLVAVRWDSKQQGWVRIPAKPGEEGEGAKVELGTTATLALVRPDSSPEAPVIPELGGALKGVTARALTGDEKVEIRADTAALFLQPGARSTITLHLSTKRPIPSGAGLELVVKEAYRFQDGSVLAPEPRVQTLRLYQDVGGLQGNLRVSPSHAFDPALLTGGGIALEVLRPDGHAGNGLIGPKGGALKIRGVNLKIPAGAVDRVMPVSLRSLPAPRTWKDNEHFDWLGGVAVGLAGGVLTKSGELKVRIDPALPNNSQILVLQPKTYGETTHLTLVAVARVKGGQLSISASGKPPLPGVRSGGRYLLARMQSPVAFVHGKIADKAKKAGRVVVSSESLPFVSLASAGGKYVLPVLTGEVQVRALAAKSGLQADEKVTLAGAGAVTKLDLGLKVIKPTVVELTPADGATGVVLTPAVYIRFNRPLDAKSLSSKHLMLKHQGKVVESRFTLAADGRALTLQPLKPLVESSRYDLWLSAVIRDTYGQGLRGNRDDGAYGAGFTTRDYTPPPRPEPGKITAAAPEDGVSRVSGGAGTVEPGSIVAVQNMASGLIETVLAEDDGSFSVKVTAGLTDELELIIRDASDNETRLPIGRVEPPPNTAVLDSQGGEIRDGDIVRAIIPPGVLPPNSIVRAEPMDIKGLQTPFSKEMPGFLTGGLNIDLNGAGVADVMELELSVDGWPDVTTRDLVPLFRIERELTLPKGLKPGDRLVFRLKARDQARQETELRVELPIVAKTTRADLKPRTESLTGAPSLQLTLPAKAVPGATITITARSDPPNIKLRFPANPVLTGQEQFFLFEVGEVDGKPFWNLVDKAELKTLEDGKRVIETSSPPYRGVRRDTSGLVMAVFATESLATWQVVSSSFSAFQNPAYLPAAVASSLNAVDGVLSLGTQMQGLQRYPDRNPHEFSVIPVKAGVPNTIEIVDPRTNERLYSVNVPPLPPGKMSEVLVLGEDNNPLMITGATSLANHAVPVDGAISLSFSHMIEPSSVHEQTLFIEDEKGDKVPAKRSMELTDDERAYIVSIRAEKPLKPDSRYRLVANPGIVRAGADHQRGLSLDKTFLLPFTTGGSRYRQVGELEIPWAKTFDVVDETVLVTRRHIPDGVNALVTVDAEDPEKMQQLTELKFDPKRDGPIWAVRGMDDVDFEGRDKEPVQGDLALVTMGNDGTFSTIRAYNVDKPAKPEWLTTTMVSVPLDVIHQSAKLIMLPKWGVGTDMVGLSTLPVTSPQDFAVGSLQMKFDIHEGFSANLRGIPKTTAYPWFIDHDDDHNVYFINQGIGLMTVDLARSIPNPPPRFRGEKFGPSYIPEDKAGALVIRDDKSLQETAKQLTFSMPAHLSESDAERIDVHGKINDPAVREVMINGFMAEIEKGKVGRPVGFLVKGLPLHEGVNRIRATAWIKGEKEPVTISLMVLRTYGEKQPLAGPGTVKISLPPMQVVSGEQIEVGVGMSSNTRYDEIWVNGRIAARCKPGKPRQESWFGIKQGGGLPCEGKTNVPLKPGINSVIATAIDLDEEFPQGHNFADLVVEEGLVVAVRKGLSIFDSAGLVRIKHLPKVVGVRVSLMRSVLVDIDDDGRVGLEENQDGRKEPQPRNKESDKKKDKGKVDKQQAKDDEEGDLDDREKAQVGGQDDDGITVFDELHNLILVGGGPSNEVTFVDITEPHKAKVLGSMPTPGPAFRAVRLPGEDIALLAAGDEVLAVDLTRAHKSGLLDEDGNQRDDRILYSVKVPGAQDIRIDEDRDLVYVLKRDVGVAVLRHSNACSRDYGVDVTQYPRERRVRYATLAQEREGLLAGIKNGLATNDCAAIKLNKNAALLSQGSSACIWRRDGVCSSAYQPGMSDYDFELTVAPDMISLAKQCGGAIEDQIHKIPGLEEAEVSVFPVRDSFAKTAYRDVAPVAGSCGGGDDPYGDLCLGRNGNILKWLLEGEWVRDGNTEFDNGIKLDEVVDLLKRPIKPPVGGVADPYSYRIDPKGNRTNILFADGEEEPSHVPRLEGMEWGCLEEFALNQSGARIRILGAGIGDVEVRSPYFEKKIHKAAKAGIRTLYGKLLSTKAGNTLMLSTSRGEYNSDLGCYTKVADPDQVIDPRKDLDYKRCESFTEYIASRALLAYKQDMRDEQGKPLLSKDEALLAWRMFRRKADVGKQILTEKAANQFIIDVMRFIRDVRKDKDISGVYLRTVGKFTDGSARSESLNSCQNKHLSHYLPGGSQSKLKLKVPARLYNAGYVGIKSLDLAFYHDGKEIKRVDETLKPGESLFLGKKTFAVSPEPLGIHEVQFLADPDELLTEYDKGNNYDGFHYYLLYPDSKADPPKTPDVRPQPPKKLPDPPASKMCLTEDGKAPPSPKLQLITTVNRQYHTVVKGGDKVELKWLVRNKGNLDLSRLTILDTLADQIDVGEIPAGQDRVFTREYQVPDENRPILGLATVKGRGPEWNGVGPVSSVVKINVKGTGGLPEIRILSPPERHPPYATMAKSMPVHGIVLAYDGMPKVHVNKIKAVVDGKGIPSRRGPKWHHYRWQTPDGQAVKLKKGKETIILALATDKKGNKATDTVTVRQIAGEQLEVVKLVNGKSLALAKPGETVNYSVKVKNNGPGPLSMVNLEDPQMGNHKPPPFALNAGQEKSFSYTHTFPAKSCGARRVNRVVATGLNAKLKPVKPAMATAEVQISKKDAGLVLTPDPVLLRTATDKQPKTTQLNTVRTISIGQNGELIPDKTDVTHTATGTRYEILSKTKKGWAAHKAFNTLWKKLMTKLGKKPEKGIKFAKIKIDAAGKLTATSNGFNFIRAVHKSKATDNQDTESCWVLVMVGFVGLDSIKIEPRSIITGGLLAGKHLTNFIAEKLKGMGVLAALVLDKKEGIKSVASYMADKLKGKQLISVNIPMFLALKGHDCSGSWDWAYQSGYSELVEVKFAFFPGYGQMGSIGATDVLWLARRFSEISSQLVTSWLVTPQVAAFIGDKPGWLVYQLLEHALTQWLVTFEADPKEGGPVDVFGEISWKNRTINGMVTAKRSGWGQVKGTLDLTKSRLGNLGQKSDSYLVIVSPRLVSTEIRVNPQPDYRQQDIPLNLGIVKGNRRLDVPVTTAGQGSSLLDLQLRGSDGRYTSVRKIRLNVSSVASAQGLERLVLDKGKDTVTLPPNSRRVLAVQLVDSRVGADTKARVKLSGDDVTKLAFKDDAVDVNGGDRVQVYSFTRLEQGSDAKPLDLNPPYKDLKQYLDLKTLAKSTAKHLLIKAFLHKISPCPINEKDLVPGKTFKTTCLEDNPKDGKYNATLDFTLEYSKDKKLALKKIEFGFPAPNFMTKYRHEKYLIRDDGLPDKATPRTARLRPLDLDFNIKVSKLALEHYGPGKGFADPLSNIFGAVITAGLDDLFAGPMKVPGPADYLRFVTVSRDIDTKAAGTDHLGVEVCSPFAGQVTDTFKPFSNKGGLTINVSGARTDDPPKAKDDQATTPEDTPVVIDVLANDKPKKKLVLKGLLTKQMNGAALITGGRVEYTPKPDWYGDDKFRYKAVDDRGRKVEAGVLVEVTPVNDPPVARDDFASTLQDTPVVIQVLTNDTDVDGDTLSVATVDETNNGITQNLGNSVRYTPNPGFREMDSFKYQVTDGKGGDHWATVKVNVLPAPDCQADKKRTNQGKSIQFLLKGHHPEERLTFELATPPEHGRVQGLPKKSGIGAVQVTYVPMAEYHGDDHFSFRVVDPHGLKAECLVEIHVNRPPKALSDKLVVQKDSQDNLIKLHAIDDPGERLVFLFEDHSHEKGGLHALEKPGDYLMALYYTPPPGFVGKDHFHFFVEDGMARSDPPGRIDIKVNAPPVAVDDEAETDEGKGLIINVLANDTDSDGHMAAVVGVDAVSRAKVEILPAAEGKPSRIRFTPARDASGLYRFSYRAADNDGAVAQAGVRVQVNAVNRPPQAVDDRAVTDAGVPVRIDVLNNDTDLDRDVLGVEAVTRPEYGRIKNEGDAIRYFPEQDFSGGDGFTYTVTDYQGGSAKAKVRIQVQPAATASGGGD